MKTTLKQEVNKSIAALQRGGTLLYPTDTVWGLGCDATDVAAVQKVKHIKRREANKGLIILLDRVARLRDYIENVPDSALALITQSKDPLTIVYPAARNLPAAITGPDGSIGIRIVRHPFCEALIKVLDKPLVSTSANLSGDPTPQAFSDLTPPVLSAVDYVVNLYRAKPLDSKPSSVVRVRHDGSLTWLRK